MIDVHCHLLPAIDDGPSNMEEALALAQAMVDNGITHAISTAHAYAGRWDNELANLSPAYAAFNEALKAKQIALEVKLGAEVRVSDALPAMLREQRLPMLGTVRGFQIMLLEMPDGHIPLEMPAMIRLMMQEGIRPLIAHPERNKAVMQAPQKADELRQMGCWLQVTAASITGQFGERVRKTTEYLLENDWVYVVATDSHNLQGRPPRLKEARDWLTAKYGAEYAQLLVQQHPADIYG